MPLPLPEGQGAAILTFNGEGEVLSSSQGMDGAEGLLPRNRALKALVGTRPLAFTGRSNQGLERVYSVVPLIEENLYALGTWPGEFDRPILHGLATYGLAARAILKTLLDYDAARLVGLDVRFSAPVYPGETVRFEIWEEGGEARFRASIPARDVVVLNNGAARFV